MTSAIQVNNPDANSLCISHFRQIREFGKLLDIFIESMEGAEIGGHVMFLSAYFPYFKQFLNNRQTVNYPLKQFEARIIEAAVDYAYGKNFTVSADDLVRLYLLACTLQCQTLVKICTDLICTEVNKMNIRNLWSVGNVIKNEQIIMACAPFVASRWMDFRRSRMFFEDTEKMGWIYLLKCPEMVRKTLSSKLNSLSTWVNTPEKPGEREARTAAFREIVPLLDFQNSSDIFVQICSGDICLPEKCRKYLAETWNSANRAPVTIKSSSPWARLGVVVNKYGGSIVKIYPTGSRKAEMEVRLPGRVGASVISFQNKLLFVGGVEFNEYTKTVRSSPRVDSMDLLTGCITALPDMGAGMLQPLCVEYDDKIFVFCNGSRKMDCPLSAQYYDYGSNRWLEIPPMKEIRWDSAVIGIPNIGVLRIGGKKLSSESGVKSTELLVKTSQKGQSDYEWVYGPILKDIMPNPQAARTTTIVIAVDLVGVSFADFSKGYKNAQWTNLSTPSFLRFELPFSKGELQFMTAIGNKIFFKATHGKELETLKINYGRRVLKERNIALTFDENVAQITKFQLNL